MAEPVKIPPVTSLARQTAPTVAHRRRALIASLVATICANLPAFLTGGLAVQMQADLDFGTTALGVAVGAFFVAGAVSSAAAGRVVEGFGAARSLRWAAAMSGIVQLVIAGLVQSFAVLVLLLVVGGLANSWAQPASNVFLARIVPPNRLGLALGLQKSAIPAAALLGGLAVPAIALTVGWRWAFVAGALLSFTGTLQIPSDGPGGDSAHAERRPSAKPDVPAVSLLVLAVGVGFGAAASGALSAFLVLSSVDAGLSEASAGIMLVVGSVAGIAVRLLVGASADRYPGRALAFISGMFAIAAVAFLLLATRSTWLYLVATPLAFATAYAWPGLFHLALVRSNPSAPGAATGLAMTGTFTGAVTGPVIFGAVAGAISYPMAWLTGALFLALGAVIVGVSSRSIHEVVPPSHLTEAQALGAAGAT
jgi:predicted MFS family arabinose efflux permease